MYFRSFFDEKLAQYSYLIGCQRTGEAIVIDPARDTSDVIKVANRKACTFQQQQKLIFMLTSFQALVS